MTRKSTQKFASPLLPIAITAILFATSFVSADEVTVFVKSGRQFTAEVSERTDGERLWLHFGTSNTVLLRPIHWTHVERVIYQGEEITVAELQSKVDEIRSASDLEVPAENKGSYVFAHGKTDAERARETLGFITPVASVSFYATVANWDKDVEPDGLVLDIRPLDINGNVVPVNGTLSVDLLASHRRGFDEVPNGRGSKVEQLGRWVRQITPDNTTVRLPFQANHPAFDTDWAANGLVHVRLTVPGHGVFEDSVDPVRVRRWSPVRDNLELNEGRRFFSVERTGRGTR